MQSQWIATFAWSKNRRIINTEGLGDSLKEALNGEAATFEGVAASVGKVVDVENPVVVVRYLNKDGSEICSQEFSAK